MTGAADYRSVSLWLDTLDEEIVPRPALRDELTADVVIVGAGFIGLWTAYSLAVADPSLAIVVLEAEVAGFGAAGRNAGFASAGIAGQARAYLARGGWDGVQRGERAMIDAIDYVGDVVRQEAIDCGWTKSGALRIATTPAQLDRVRAGVERRRRGDLAESDVRFLSAAELTDRARIARVVVQATEAFTVNLPGHRRDYMPVVSHMVATEPLDEATWAAIGWERSVPATSARRRSTPSSSGRSAPGSRPPPTRRSATGGAACSRCHATGACRSRSIAPPDLPGRVGSPVTGSSPRACAGGRSPT